CSGVVGICDEHSTVTYSQDLVHLDAATWDKQFTAACSENSHQEHRVTRNHRQRCLTDKVKVKEQSVEAEQSLEKIQEEEVRKLVSATDTQSEDEEESQFETKAQEVKVKVKEFSFSCSSESDSEEEESACVFSPRRPLLNIWRFHRDNFHLWTPVVSDAERPMWLPEHCVLPVDVPADTKDHEDDPDSTNIGTGAMDVGYGFLNSAPLNASSMSEFSSVLSTEIQISLVMLQSWAAFEAQYDDDRKIVTKSLYDVEYKLFTSNFFRMSGELVKFISYISKFRASGSLPAVLSSGLSSLLYLLTDLVSDFWS
ncbi:hypothetical protein STEG23_022683, partial [Scotinomys teguina]